MEHRSPCPPGDITGMPVEMRSRQLLTDRQTDRRGIMWHRGFLQQTLRFMSTGRQVSVCVCVCVGVLAWILGTLTSGQFTVWWCDTCGVNNRLQTFMIDDEDSCLVCDVKSEALFSSHFPTSVWLQVSRLTRLSPLGGYPLWCGWRPAPWWLCDSSCSTSVSETRGQKQQLPVSCCLCH